MLGSDDAELPRAIVEHLTPRLRAAFPPVGLLGDADARALGDRVAGILSRIDRVADAHDCLAIRLDAVERDSPPTQENAT